LNPRTMRRHVIVTGRNFLRKITSVRPGKQAAKKQSADLTPTPQNSETGKKRRIK